MSYPPIPPERRDVLFEQQAKSPHFDAATGLPGWFWRRWHFHPGGYFTDSALTFYEAFIVRLYNYFLERRVHREIARRARRFQPATLLEIGCGPGHALQRFARWLPGSTLTGVDLAPRMLERAAVRLGDAATLLHRDASTNISGVGPQDVLVSVHVPGHVPPGVATGIVEQGAEVLRPGGHWIMVEHAWHRLPPMPPTLRLVEREKLLGGLQVLRIYRKAR